MRAAISRPSQHSCRNAFYKSAGWRSRSIVSQDKQHDDPRNSQPNTPTRTIDTLSGLFPKVGTGEFLITMIGMFRFDTSTALLGKGRVVDELCVPIRAPYFNINGKHGASDAKLTDDAVASDSRGEPLPARRRKLHKAIQ
ncbi:hypothetical protein QP162_19280 [Sphingomonas aurantiaca]|uniref:hypothetical protein n=1 Tax=Sphingomonas aurantiaca TaxID=185949 RepID=UPI002FE00025